MSLPALEERTGFSRSSVRQAVRALQRMGIVKAAQGTSPKLKLYYVQKAYFLYWIIELLFAREADRYDAILLALSEAASHCQGLVAAWVYGSFARGEVGQSNIVDVVVVVSPNAASKMETRLRDLLRVSESQFGFTAAIVSIESRDVVQLYRKSDQQWLYRTTDARPIFGKHPRELVVHLSVHEVMASLSSDKGSRS